MRKNSKMKIALLGFGTVGVGVYEMIKKSDTLECAKILVRPGKEEPPLKVSDLKEILFDENISCVVEVMGGVDPAYDYAVSCLNCGKHFVTSNKALVAEKGLELSRLAQEKEVSFLFSAACGGAIPFLHNLSLAAQTDEIEEIGGILNGTTNYILDAMQSRDWSFDKALKEAQNLGFAEKDPGADLSGLDTLRKIVLACMVGYKKLPKSGLCREGIESFTSRDAAFLKANGLTCRLLATAREEGGILSAFVEPVLYKEGDEATTVRENYNYAYYIGKSCGKMTFSGQGAGRYPTASAVLRDLSSIRCGQRQMLSPSCTETAANNRTCIHTYLLRTGDSVDFDLPSVESIPFDGFIYRIIPGISCRDMHELSGNLRLAGEDNFFARIN